MSHDDKGGATPPGIDDAGGHTVEIGLEGRHVVVALPRALDRLKFEPHHALEVGLSMLRHARRAGMKTPPALRLEEQR